MSIRLWDKGTNFNTIVRNQVLRIIFTKDVYIEVPFKYTDREYKGNPIIPFSDISLCCYSKDSDLIVGWHNNDTVRLFEPLLDGRSRLVGLGKFDLPKLLEDKLIIYDKGTIKLGFGYKVTVSDVYDSRFYLIKDTSYLIMDRSDLGVPYLIDTKENSWLLYDLAEQSKSKPALVEEFPGGGLFDLYTKREVFHAKPLQLPTQQYHYLGRRIQL